jgi:hypothetical protein
MEAMRAEQNVALAREAWKDATQIQGALITVLDASAGVRPIGMTMDVITSVGGVCQRLFKRIRNRGENNRAGAYLRYVEDLHGIMRG